MFDRVVMDEAQVRRCARSALPNLRCCRFRYSEPVSQHNQLMSNLGPSTRGAGNLISGKSMDASPVNGLFSIQFSLS